MSVSMHASEMVSWFFFWPNRYWSSKEYEMKGLASSFLEPLQKQIREERN